MNLIWHIVKKDFRRFWLPIVVMAAVLVIKAVLYNIDVTGIWPEPVALNGITAINRISDIGLHYTRQIAVAVALLVPVLNITDYVMLIVIVLGVLMEDPTIGNKTFWRTRPIAGWRMLAAKALFLFLVTWVFQAALQVATNLWPIIYSHFNKVQIDSLATRHWYDALGTLTLNQAEWISLLGITVLLWRSPLVGVASLLVFYFIEMFFVLMIRFAIHFQSQDFQLSDTRNSIGLAIWFCTIAAVAAWMYCKRRRLTGFLIFGLGQVILAMIMVF